MTRAENAELQQLEHAVTSSQELTETQKTALRCLLDKIREVWNGPGGGRDS